ncbi:hypothetical protein [Blastococcus saxobsidens]|uniref:Uncharacterized protein n=1 Tax=Blastococcus saxobsidens TaxID=138336 RepID=A0A4Q7Y902_9ACTN|nr:hypothetical protein [Blastococcus saxobsidens]RZU33480.1 hypothetical protein BKA19_3209 [Blastococcus saxobsidens]
MPASSAPRPVGPGALPQSPPSVRVAIALLSTLAVLLLLYVTVTWLGRDGLIEALTDSGLTRDEAERFLVINTSAPLVMGLLFGVSAWGVAKRHSWGRWVGVVAAVVLAGLVSTTMLTAGGITVVSLLLFVLAVATAASLLSRTTREWLAAG